MKKIILCACTVLMFGFEVNGMAIDRIAEIRESISSSSVLERSWEVVKVPTESIYIQILNDYVEIAKGDLSLEHLSWMGQGTDLDIKLTRFRERFDHKTEFYDFVTKLSWAALQIQLTDKKYMTKISDRDLFDGLNYIAAANKTNILGDQTKEKIWQQTELMRKPRTSDGYWYVPTPFLASFLDALGSVK